MDQKYAGIGARNLQRNRRWLAKKLGVKEDEVAHTPPAPGHYPHIYLWDSCFAAIINARAGGQWIGAAQREMLRLVAGQDPATGFIANMQYIPNGGREFDLERRLAFGGKGAQGSSYSQPPILALTVMEIYEALLREKLKQQAVEFVRKIYANLHDYYRYWEKYRSNSAADPLIGVIHEHETGRDSDPTFHHKKPLLLPRFGLKTPRLIDWSNVLIDYGYSLHHSRQAARAGGDVAKARRKFWVNDVMMNCIYVDNLRTMSALAKITDRVTDAGYFSKLATRVEAAIYDKMWDSEDRIFYALNSAGQKIREITVSNLFPLVLPNLDAQKLEALLDLLDRSFDTPYPLPSVATDSRNYDPHNHQFDRLWAGPVWINANWYIVDRGLRRHGQSKRCQQWAERIVSSSRRLVDNGDADGPHEYYDPITGRAMRRRIKSFAWSNLAYVM